MHQSLTMTISQWVQLTPFCLIFISHHQNSCYVVFSSKVNQKIRCSTWRTPTWTLAQQRWLVISWTSARKTSGIYGRLAYFAYRKDNSQDSLCILCTWIKSHNIWARLHKSYTRHRFLFDLDWLIVKFAFMGITDSLERIIQFVNVKILTRFYNWVFAQ